MLVKVIRQNGKGVGWTIIAEDEGDRLTLGSIRNMQFFGMKSSGTDIKYAGVKSWPENEEYAHQMAWIQSGVRDEFSISKLDNNMNMPNITINGDPNDKHEAAIDKLGD